ncbi:MAG: hypothetical protein ABI954_12300 [Pyrinomonadaceae bacterium]
MDFQSGGIRPIGNVEEGWGLIKSDYWLFFAMTLVSALIVLAVFFVLSFVFGAISSLISVGLGVATQNANDIGKVSASVAPQLISQVLSIFTGLITATLSGLLTCGIYTALSRKANGGIPQFSDLFEGFKYFQQCLIFSLIITLIHFVINVVFILIGVALGVSAFGAGLLTTRNGKFDPSVLAPIIGVVVVMALIYIVIFSVIGVCTFFTYPLIAERKLSAIGALKESAKAGISNFFSLIGLFIIQFFIALGGALLCGIGILFVLPILSATIFAAYLSVFGRTPQVGQQMPPTPDSFGGDYGRPNYGGQNYGGM